MEGATTDELTRAALDAFHPIVINITSSTPGTVAIPHLIQQLATSLPDRFFVLDAADVRTETQQKATGKKSRAATRPDGSAGSVVDASKSVAPKLRELYVQVAVALETSRRDAAAARRAAVLALRDQFVEDGLPAAEALSAAEAELAQEEDEADSTGEFDDDDGVPPARRGYPFATTDRAPQVVCLVNYPSSLEDVEELSKADVALHAVLDIQSDATFGPTQRASVTTSPVDKRAASRGSHAKISPIAEVPVIESLAQALSRHQREVLERPPKAGTPLTSVLVHTIEVPCEPIAGDVQGRLRVTVTEKAFMESLTETLWDLEAKLFSFRAWSAIGCEVVVPRYTPLANPDAPPDLSEIEAEENAKRKSTGKKAAAAGASTSATEEETIPAVPQTTPVHPASMNEVAADRTEFDAYMRTHGRDARPAVARFAQACIAQVASSSGATSLPTRAHSDALRVAADATKTARFLRGVWGALTAAPQRQEEVAVVSSGASAGSGALTAALFQGPTLADTLHIAASSPAMSSRSPREQAQSNSDDLRAAQEQAPATLADCLTRMLRGVSAMQDRSAADVEALVTDLLACGLLPFSGADLAVMSDALAAKNCQGWRVQRRAVGANTVYSLVRGLTATRTQHGTYGFTGATSFPEYAQLLDAWHREDLFFHPLPLPSDDEAADEEDGDGDEEEESFVEDDDGNLIRRPRRVPTPPPPQDHAHLIAATLRRRRVLEEVTRVIRSPPRQSLLALGEGAITACEEVEWVLLPDSLVEVERRVGNTRAVAATVATVHGAEFGFLVDDPTSDSDAQPPAPNSEQTGGDADKAATTVPAHHVRSGVRTFVHLGRSLRLQAEVLADNTAAAEAASYAIAVDKAKKQARAQFDAANARLKTLKGKEKQSTQVQTLEEMERDCLETIPVPLRCRKELPEVRLSARLPQAVLQFDEARAAIRACVPQHTSEHAVAALTVLAPDPANANKAHTVALRGLRLVTYYAKGVAELGFDSAPGLVVALHPDGSYVTCALQDGHIAGCVTVSARGLCTVRSAGETHALPSLGWSPVLTSGGRTTGFVRADEVRVDGDLSEGVPARVVFSEGVQVCRGADGASEWRVCGLPLVCCRASAATVTVHQPDCQLCYDLSAATVTVRTSLYGALAATVDLVDYAVRVRTADPSSVSRAGGSGSTAGGAAAALTGVFAIDAAFGGMVCGTVHGPSASSSPSSSSPMANVVCRVSPLGACTVENVTDGRLRLPATYPISGEHDDGMPIRHRETVRPAFVQALESTDVRYPRDALHWRRPDLAQLDESAPRVRTKGRAAAVASVFAPETTAVVQAAAQALHLPSLQHALHVHDDAPATTVHACCIVVGPSGGKLAFLNAPCRAALLRRWVSELCPLSLPPIAVAPAVALVDRLPQVAVALRDTHNAHGADGGCLSWRLLINTTAQQEQQQQPSSSRLTMAQVSHLVSASPAAKAALLDFCLGTAATRTPYCVEETASSTTLAASSQTRVVALDVAARRTKDDDGPQRKCAADARHVLRFWDSEAASRATTKTGKIAPVRATPGVLTSSNAAAPRPEQRVTPPASQASATPPPPPPSDPATLYASKAADSYGGNPLMRSRGAVSFGASGNAASPTLDSFGATASSYGHHPTLAVTPAQVLFGALKVGRVYAILVYVTNTSTVPCRYRVAATAEFKPYVSLHYPHRFLAAGMTDAVQVTISGRQPIGELNTTLLLTHEGGNVSIHVVGTTVAQERETALAAGVSCLGETAPAFTPGTTRRVKPCDSDNDDGLGGDGDGDDDDTSSEDATHTLH